METIDRKSAMKLGRKTYFTGKACPSGHISERITSSRKCVMCNREYQSKRFREDSQYREKANFRFSMMAKNGVKPNKESRSKWRRNNKGLILSKKRDDYAKNPIPAIMRAMVRRTLSGDWPKLRTEQILGYSKEKLLQRLECQFKPGMTFNNYGQWHIDHKKPISAFKTKNPSTINMLCNLQPLWWWENLEKGSRFK